MVAASSLWLLVPYTLFADDVLPRLEVASAFGAKIYTNVRVLTADGDNVRVSHDAGISVVPRDSFPKGWLKGSVAKSVPSTATPDKPAVITAASSGPFDPACLIIIKTDKGSGSGFIARANGRDYVYTNAHVICGGRGSFTSKISSIKTTDGRVIPTPYELEISETYDPDAPMGLEDVARFSVAVPAGVSPYEIGDLDVASALGEQVVAYGNSLGSDVMTALEGSIVGLGTDRFEINCEIVPGNSGGPVILSKSKRVAGISTYLTNDGARDIWSKDTRFGDVRRFAVRPDKVTKWRKLSYTALITSLEELNSFDRDTLTLAAACFLDPKPNRGGFDVPTTQKGDYIVKTLIIDGGKHPLGKVIAGGITRVNERMGQSVAIRSMAAAVPIFGEFFSNVTRASAAQMNSLSTADRVPYLKKLFPQMIESRKEWHNQFIQEGMNRYR